MTAGALTPADPNRKALRPTESLSEDTVTDPAPLQALRPDGSYAPEALGDDYAPYLAQIDEVWLRSVHAEMVLMRAFDAEATALQRQGQLALWIPSKGQEAAQLGSGHAAKAHDFIFPAYREHAVAHVRGVDLVDVLRLLRGHTHGGWDPKAYNFNIYTLVIGSQALHATGYAMGVRFDGVVGTGDAERDTAVMVYFGDGATSQGDVSEAFVFAASYQTPQVFFLQNNHWAISVPVQRQSRTPLYLRSQGFGIPSVQIDGNDVITSYAVTAKLLDDARSGKGPAFIEALTYRLGAHTTSDDPTRYEDADLHASWAAKDPLIRLEAHLRTLGVEEAHFATATEAAHDFALDARRRLLALPAPDAANIFQHVYAEEHPVTAEQQAWLERYEASFEEAGA